MAKRKIAYGTYQATQKYLEGTARNALTNNIPLQNCAAYVNVSIEIWRRKAILSKINLFILG
jgi:hypothetical protein